ncbi:MAG: ThuA domain-containing protein [Acidobacteriales bacterium]|nr:ThuA domain-containing protein [Terriglobales bacterium]
MRKDFAARYVEIVFHDLGETIGDEEKANPEALGEAGKGIFSIHHDGLHVLAVAVRERHRHQVPHKDAGRSCEIAYKENVDLSETPVVGVNHPMTRGVEPIPVTDDVYRGMWHLPTLAVLMETDNRLNDEPVVYLGPHLKARVVYIELGRGEDAIRHPGHRRLVRNAILWSVGKLK